MWLAIIGDYGYWPYTSGKSVRLYTDECVVDSGTGLMGPCTRSNQWTGGVYESNTDTFDRQVG